MHEATRDLLSAVQGGRRPDAAEALALAAEDDLAPLLDCAAALRDRAHPDIVTYSRKVFIPLTHLCRDVCHYCTFARPPRRGETAFMTPDQVLRVAQAGAAAGCKEALFTLGDKPELRYRAARENLEALGFASTLAYLAAMAKLVLEETPLLPHLNPGVLSREDLRALRAVSASQGMMLESASERLSAKGGPHYGSPDKRPAARLETLRLAGEEAVPFTSGILIGIGETREERIEALLALRDSHDAHGHIQEIIVQNFRAKPGTRMATAPEPSLDELLWTIAVARILFGPEANIQAPPNLSPGALLTAGCGGDQRLGRRLPRDAGLRQSRGAVAASRRARTRDRRCRQNAERAAHDLSVLRAFGRALARSDALRDAGAEDDRFHRLSPYRSPGSRARARRRRRIAHPRRRSWRPTSSAFWPAPRLARASTKTSWCGSSRRAAAPSTRCARLPTGSGHGLAGPR